MASLALSNEEEAVLKGMMKELEEEVNNGEEANYKQQVASNQVYTRGHIKNETADDKQLAFSESHDWSGTADKDHGYPKTIYNGEVAEFFHDGPTSPGSGSKGAVVYSDPAQHYWLVAFHNPRNKVYVEAGPAITTIDWSSVETKLDSSGSKSSFRDPKSGGFATAVISGGRVSTKFRSY